MKRVSASLCIALLASLPVRADDALPIEVRDSIQEHTAKEHTAGCDSTPIFEPGFISKVDVNGDGISDYILDYPFYKCGHRSPYCGTGGCLRTVFVSAPGKKTLKIFDERVRSLTFKHLSGRPAMLIERDGSTCGKPGYQACSETLYWNGQRFTPALTENR